MSDMQKYRNKASGEEVEAMQLTPDTASRLVHITGGLQVKEEDPIVVDKSYVGINILGYTGMFRASEGDYVIKLRNGNFAKVSDRLFEHAYEEV